MANQSGHRRFGSVRKLPVRPVSGPIPGPGRSGAQGADDLRHGQGRGAVAHRGRVGNHPGGMDCTGGRRSRTGRLRAPVDRRAQAAAAHPRDVRGPVPAAHSTAAGFTWCSAQIKPQTIRTWRKALLDGGTPEPQAVKSYCLLRAILNTAMKEDEIIRANPCRIKGYDTYHTPERPMGSVEQVSRLAALMPDRYVALILVAAFSGLRWGELVALRRGDVDLDAGAVRVPRKLALLRTGLEFGPPKSEAGTRKVALPSTALKALRAHMADFTGGDAEALVFTGAKGATLRSANFTRAVRWSAVRVQAGLPANFTFHDLRHTGNTLAAASGASTRELMHRMGHASMRAALIYQHATSERDSEIAEAMDKRISRK